MRRLATAFVVLGLIGVGSARAEPGQVCNVLPVEEDTYAGGDPRVREEVIDGVRTLVLVPPDYETSGRRYPVVWLFHGGASREDCYLTRTGLIGITSEIPDQDQMIVVMPDGSFTSAWLDWRDGQFEDETRFLETFIPAIEARYRAIPRRAHRAIAGFSFGGFGAMHLAARHPDVFVAAASISGVVESNETDPVFLGLGSLIGLMAPVAGGEVSPTGPFGDPLTDAIWWRNVDPVTLAMNFGGTHVSITSGNGIPCDERDALEYNTTFPFSLGEGKIRDWADRLSAALREARVPHATNARACGVHTYRWVEAGLRGWLPSLAGVFGSRPPARFDFRRADESFSVWGWTFRADPARAPEFLDVTDASCRGLGLSGSGTTTVTTTRCFTPRSTVRVNGVALRADARGRLRFTVDLGPANQHQQYTPAARALEAAGRYWTSTTVRMREMR